ncbi:MAG: pilus assembly protein PilZ [Cycloclasticus sp. symbiont of Bathymodiolus heckerae]|nr:MAG: pilus assembly protein PilZ [Cycloclasticus sp. symbiont of Bathymodiolus heckerae]
MSQEEGLERRGFFRINDEVALTYRLMSDDEVKRSGDALKVNDNAPLSLVNELEKMNDVSRIHLRHVEKESPEVARYFSFIEAKINLLAHHMMMASDALFVKSTQPVNISGSGVSFTTDELLDVGARLEIKFILMPSLATIKTFSEIVSCKPEGEKFRVAVEYSQLTDGDRDLLIRHVVKKQMNEIRESSE